MNPQLRDQLEDLRDSYTYRLNILLEQGREDLADTMSAQYTAERATLLRRTA